MAVYTQLGPEQVNALLAHYDVGELVSLKGIAEGVETVAQKRALLDGGCTIGQGYLWAPPIPSSFFFNEMAWMPKLHINGYQGVRHDLVQ